MKIKVREKMIDENKSEKNDREWKEEWFNDDK